MIQRQTHQASTVPLKGDPLGRQYSYSSCADRAQNILGTPIRNCLQCLQHSFWNTFRSGKSVRWWWVLTRNSRNLVNNVDAQAREYILGTIWNVPLSHNCLSLWPLTQPKGIVTPANRKVSFQIQCFNPVLVPVSCGWWERGVWVSPPHSDSGTQDPSILWLHSSLGFWIFYLWLVENTREHG